MKPSTKDRILAALRLMPLSIPQLCRCLTLCHQTVWQAVRSLRKHGLLYPLGFHRAGRKSAVLWRICA